MRIGKNGSRKYLRCIIVLTAAARADLYQDHLLKDGKAERGLAVM
jgi:hypothetical protein